MALNPFRSARKKMIRIFHRLARINGTPREIALGAALGILIGMTPFWGLQIALSLFLSSLLGWNRIACIIGANITNVATAPLIYPITYWVGMRLVGASEGTRWPVRLDPSALVTLVTQSPRILADLTVGGLVTGLPLSVGIYFLMLKGVCIYRHRR